MANVIKERIQKFQSLLAGAQLSAYVVPSADAHQSEYVAPRWSRREYISGFTGSAGLFAIKKDEAGLWTDGRYFEQAEAELKGTGITLFRQGLPGVPDWQKWMIDSLPKGSRVGINPELFSLQNYQRISQGFKEAGLELVDTKEDLIDRLWGKDQPELPHEKFYLHPLKYAGQSHEEKIEKVARSLAEANAQSLVLSALDEIAWLFNLRGKDVPNNPVFYAYAIIQSDKSATLYTSLDKIDDTLKSALGPRVSLKAYDRFFADLGQLKGSVWCDPTTTSAAVTQTLEARGLSVYSKTSPIPAWKAVKNEAELEGMKAAHRRDGLAMVKFSRWLKESIGHTPIDEISAADKLEEFRSESKDFLGPSFSTIAGYGAHGALPHYRSTPETNVPLQTKGIFLLDSGAQYPDGTTDITRTYALGTPTQHERFVYTTVLKGHLLLARSVFPKGVNGYQLDAIARQPIWKEGLEYNHGTGHGVGAALCVHEGPFSVSPRVNLFPLEAGHILSNEPACYFAGSFGVRIENLVYVVSKTSKHGFGEFLGFEDLTLCPYDRSLIDKTLLSPEDIRDVDAYHSRVEKELSPSLQGKDLAWLKEATAAL